jgi:hypothetical protein
MLALRLHEVKHNEPRSCKLSSLAIILLIVGNRALRTLARVGFAYPAIPDTGMLPSCDIEEEAVVKSVQFKQCQHIRADKAELVR